MAYNEFAYYYDEFNTAADYDALYRYVTGELAARGVPGGLLADLGCGTGDLTLMLAQAGYDVIGVDQSEEMLSVLREKADELGLAGRILLLRQDHICSWTCTGPSARRCPPSTPSATSARSTASSRPSPRPPSFMEEGGVFVFDLNTPYKHARVLAGQTFDLDAGDALLPLDQHATTRPGRPRATSSIRRHRPRDRRPLAGECFPNTAMTRWTP